MSHDSAPGKDGLPMEFYRTFSNLIKEDFTNLVNYIFFEKKKKIAKSMKTAIILLITKTSPEETNIAKWRPVSLLCVDYKIITKTITNRLLIMKLFHYSCRPQSQVVIYMKIFSPFEI